MHKKGLSPKQEKFAQLYVELGNARQAFIEAYGQGRMSMHVIDQRAFERRRHPAIAARIEELRAKLLERHEVTVDRIVQELAMIAFASMADYVAIADDGSVTIELREMGRDRMAVISELTTDGKQVKVKLSDKQAALEKLGRHLGMFPSQVQGKIDHNHQHNHEHRAVSETARWIEDVLGAGAGRPSEESVPE